MNSVKEFGILDQDLSDNIENFVINNSSEMNDSKMYSTEKNELFIDKNIRSSKFRIINDEELFNMFENLINKINEKDKNSDFIIVRNNITHIKYESGDFFKEHEDYLSMTSNAIQEYTMIYCLNANCEGGETVLKINDFFTHESKASITKNNILIFRKDIRHEGKKLLSGIKEILTLNLWSISKINGRKVIINFQNSPGIYVIPYENIMDQESLIKTTIEYNEEDNIYFTSINFKYEDFTIVYDILMKIYISISDWENYSDIIDYFGINIKNVLFSNKLSKLPKVRPYNLGKDDIIILNTQEHTEYLNLSIKDNFLQYLSFFVIFAEGQNSFVGNMTEDPLKYNMDPVYCSFSDYNSVLLFNKLMDTNASKPNYNFPIKINYNNFIEKEDKNILNYPIIKLYPFENESDDENEEEDEEDEDFSVEWDKVNKIYQQKSKKSKLTLPIKKLEASEDVEFCNMTTSNLKFGFKDISLNSIIKYLFLNNNNIMIKELLYNTDHDFFKEEVEYKNKKTGEVKLKTPKNYGGYWLDTYNNTFLDNKQQENLINRINKLDFFNKIKNQINDINFILPQVKVESANHFCNEDVYSKMNLIIISGFIKL